MIVAVGYPSEPRYEEEEKKNIRKIYILSLFIISSRSLLLDRNKIHQLISSQRILIAHFMRLRSETKQGAQRKKKEIVHFVHPFIQIVVAEINLKLIYCTLFH